MQGMASELAAGRLVAVELVGDDAVHAFRQACGPRHVDVAKRILPDTLRAKYGVDTIKNAVHCTDLDEDGVLEVRAVGRGVACSMDCVTSHSWAWPLCACTCHHQQSEYFFRILQATNC